MYTIIILFDSTIISPVYSMCLKCVKQRTMIHPVIPYLLVKAAASGCTYMCDVNTEPVLMLKHSFKFVPVKMKVMCAS